MTVVEICLDDLAGVGVAERAGADRIELCAALGDGGITPSIGTVATVLRSITRVDVNVLIRQRAGDFVYAPDEVDAMVADIQAIRRLPRVAGIRLGFVVGALAPDGSVDTATTAALLEACGDAEVTFHKAFDEVPDRPAALDELSGLGIRRVLTSGGSASAAEGSAELAALVAHAAGRIRILAGGGVRPANVAELVAKTGVPEVHLRAPEQVSSAGAPGPYDSGTRTVTSGRIITELLTALGRYAA